MWTGMYVLIEDRGQLLGIDCLLPPSGFWDEGSRMKYPSRRILSLYQIGSAPIAKITDLELNRTGSAGKGISLRLTARLVCHLDLPVASKAVLAFRSHPHAQAGL